MIESLYSLVTLAAMTLSAYGLGRWLLVGLRLRGDDEFEDAIWATALGWVVCGWLLWALGSTGLYYRALLAIVTSLAAFWGLGEAAQAFFRWRYARKLAPHAAELSRESLRTRFSREALVLLALLAAGASLISALAPPTAGDALCYHLDLPKRFLAAHAIRYSPWEENGTFPLQTELWYLWALALDGGVAAQLVHWSWGVLLAGATVVLARPVLGERGARLAGTVVLLTPGVTNQMTVALNDVALAAQTTLAIAAWRRAIWESRGRSWWIVAGLLLGGAMATKYAAALVAIALAVDGAWRCAMRRTAWREALLGMATASVLCASVAGPWYLRAAWYRGNPVYPFFGHSQPNADVAGFPSAKRPLSASIAGLVSAPWQLTMKPERFGGRGHQWGPWCLMSLPALVLVRRLRGLGSLLIMSAIYAAGWFVLRQNLRFLLPVLPVAAVAGIWVWMELETFPRLPALAAQAALSAALIFGAAVPWRRGAEHVPVAAGMQSRNAYLSAHEPTFAAAEIVNRMCSQWPQARLLSQDYRAFYFDCDVTRESVYRRGTGYIAESGPAEDLSTRLQARGFTHVLLAENHSGRGIAFDDTLSRRVDAALQVDLRHSLLCLSDYEFADSDGARRRYRLYLLR